MISGSLSENEIQFAFQIEGPYTAVELGEAGCR
jgi:hypothetical protein